MTDGLKDAHRTAIVNVLRANGRVERAVLFGSRAMETFTRGSDVDIALFGEALTTADRARLAAAMEELTVPQRVDLLLYNGIEDAALRKHVRRDGIELYRKRENALASRLDVPEAHRRTLVSLSHEHLPGVEVWACGRRVNGRGRDGSALDLVLRGPGLEEIPADRLVEFREALRKSSIPLPVEARDWACLPERIRRGIEQEHEVIVDSSKGEENARNWLYSPQFPGHWKPTPLYSAAQWTNGLAFRNIEFGPTGKPVIKIAEIKGGISAQTKFTNQTFDDSVRVRSGDLLFSWSGQPETSIDAFWWRGPEGWLNQHVFRVTPIASIDTTFFFYFLRYLKPNFVAIARNKQTTGLGHVTKRDLIRIEAAFPLLSEQRAIAHILGTLDDKIELNRRMNETLEAMTQVIFKDWFVDFGPVRAKMEGREPYLPSEIWNLFPDALDDEDRPVGWRTYTLSDLAHHHRSTVSPSFEPGRIFEHYSIPSYDTGSGPATDLGASIKSNKTIVPEGAVLLSKINPEIERVWLPNSKGEMHQIASTEFLALTPLAPATCSVLYCLFRSPIFRSEMVARITGTSRSHQRVPPKSLLACEALTAKSRLLALFDATVSPMMNRLLSNRRESRGLNETRDLLLPKLMSGDIRLRATESPGNVDTVGKLDSGTPP